jgi:hypothetical protein
VTDWHPALPGLHQARAARRLAQGRAKPIDLLARDLYNIRVGDDTDEAREAPSDDDDEEEWGGAARRAADQRLKRGTDGPGLSMMVPSEVFQGLMLEDMEQLYDDVRGFKVGCSPVISPCRQQRSWGEGGRGCCTPNGNMGTPAETGRSLCAVGSLAGASVTSMFKQVWSAVVLCCSAGVGLQGPPPCPVLGGAAGAGGHRAQSSTCS